MEHGPKSQDPGTWAWTARRRHGPPASALPLKPRLNHIKSWRLSGCSGLTRLGWRPPFKHWALGLKKQTLDKSKAFPTTFNNPTLVTEHTTSAGSPWLVQDGTCYVGSAGPASSRDGTTAPVYDYCGSLAQPRVKGPESRDRRKRTGAQLIDPQRGTGCNCLRDGGEPDGNA